MTLRKLGVTQVVVVGVLANMAVERSVRGAADCGYEVTLVSTASLASAIGAELLTPTARPTRPEGWPGGVDATGLITPMPGLTSARRAPD